MGVVEVFAIASAACAFWAAVGEPLRMLLVALGVG